MLDLNDFYFFHTVSLHKGFSAAARASGIPKATLSKRVAMLEEAMGVRLLERTTRSLRLTQVGVEVFAQVEAMLASADAAAASAAQAQAEPNGFVRVACPQGLIQDLIINLLPRFLQLYPKVKVQLKVINRPADLVEDGVDIALRARARLDTDPNLIVRKFGETRSVLVASPALLEIWPAPLRVEDIAGMPTLTQYEERSEVTWTLIGPENAVASVVHHPRLMCTSFDVLRTNAEAGIGLTLLPEFVAASALTRGTLVPVLPDWHTPPNTLHAVFSSRRGLVPAVRVWLDFLAQEIPTLLSSAAADGSRAAV